MRENYYTSVIFHGKIQNGSGILVFWPRGEKIGKRIKVSSLKDGIITIIPSFNDEISWLAKIVAGCFNEKSNFLNSVAEIYGLEKEKELKEIHFEFKGVKIVVIPENATTYEISKVWEEKMKLKENQQGKITG